MKKIDFYRKVIKVGGGRYLAVGSFVPKDWQTIHAKVTSKSSKIVIEIEKI